MDDTSEMKIFTQDDHRYLQKGRWSRLYSMIPRLVQITCAILILILNIVILAQVSQCSREISDLRKSTFAASVSHALSPERLKAPAETDTVKESTKNPFSSSHQTTHDPGYALQQLQDTFVSTTRRMEKEVSQCHSQLLILSNSSKAIENKLEASTSRLQEGISNILDTCSDLTKSLENITAVSQGLPELESELQEVNDSLQIEIATQCSSLQASVSNVQDILTSRQFLTPELPDYILSAIDRMETLVGDMMTTSKRENRNMSRNFTQAVLDVFSSIDVVGKTLNSDIENRKNESMTFGAFGAAISEELQKISQSESLTSQAISDILPRLKTVEETLNRDISARREQALAVETVIADMQQTINQSQSLTCQAVTDIRVAFESLQTLMNETKGYDAGGNVNSSSLDYHVGSELVKNITEVLTALLNEAANSQETSSNVLASSLSSMATSMSDLVFRVSTVRGNVVDVQNKVSNQDTAMSDIQSNLQAVLRKLVDLPTTLQIANDATSQKPSVQFCFEGKGCEVIGDSNRNNGDFRWFKVSTQTATWQQAQKNCAAIGGYLVEILDQQTLTYINQLPLPSGVWIGGSDLQEEGKWIWSTSGIPVLLNVWNGGQPDNWRAGEHCMESNRYNNVPGRPWNDAPCSSKRHYVCEKFSTNCDGWA